MSVYHCEECGVELQGNAHRCVKCERDNWEACLCTRLAPGGKSRRQWTPHKFPPVPHCKQCGGTGFVRRPRPRPPAA